MCFYGFYFAVCVFLVVFLNSSLLSFFVSLFVFKTEKERTWIQGWEVGSILEELGRGERDQNILYKKLFSTKTRNLHVMNHFCIMEQESVSFRS